MLKIEILIRKSQTGTFETRAKKLINCPCFKKFFWGMIMYDDLDKNVEEMEGIK